VYSEVVDWEPPTAGVRCILEFGETTLITQVAEPSTLPPPAPVEVLDQYTDLPLLPHASEDADSLHGAFHEVCVDPNVPVVQQQYSGAGHCLTN